MRHIYTIGHSTQPMEDFLRLLQKHSVTAIADVRSTPFSKHAPHFSRDHLESSLELANIAYVFLGKELGARSDDGSCYVGNKVSYGKLSKTSLFRAGIERVETGSDRFKVALMCSERDPTECHRTILVSKVLTERGVVVDHILGDGTLEPHEQTMLRVLDLLGMPREDMFNSREELIAKAYEGRERQIAYRREA